MDTFSAKIYTGNYCFEKKPANMIAVNFEGKSIPDKLSTVEYSGKNKKLILVIDVSGSMNSSMPLLKASLLATRDLLLNLSPPEVAQLSPEERDQRLRKIIPLVLITFSDEAKLIWNSESSPYSFEHAVHHLKAEMKTNMGAGLEMAYTQIKNEIGWIVVLTDGISNVGAYQRATSFSNLAKLRPKHSKIIPLGYGTSFDVETLDKMGNYTYVNNSEVISSVFGSLIYEIMTAYGVDGKIILPSPFIELPEDELIKPIQEEEHPRTIIGASDFGTLFSQRKFLYVHLPFGYQITPEINRYLGQIVKIRYFDILSLKEVEISTDLRLGEEIPEELIKAYYDTSKGHLMLSLYAYLQRKDTQTFILWLKKKLETWRSPLAQEAKEELLRIIEESQKPDQEIYFSLSSATDILRQSSYHYHQYQTPIQISSANLNHSNTAFYLPEKS